MLTQNTTKIGSDDTAVLPIDTNATRAQLAALAETIAQGGMAADPVNVLLVAHTARDLGVSATLVSVLADEQEPSVARERAFGRVSALIDARLDVIHARTMLPVTC